MRRVRQKIEIDANVLFFFSCPYSYSSFLLPSCIHLERKYNKHFDYLDIATIKLHIKIQQNLHNCTTDEIVLSLSSLSYH